MCHASWNDLESAQVYMGKRIKEKWQCEECLLLFPLSEFEEANHPQVYGRVCHKCLRLREDDWYQQCVKEEQRGED